MKLARMDSETRYERRIASQVNAEDAMRRISSPCTVDMHFKGSVQSNIKNVELVDPSAVRLGGIPMHI